MAEKNNTQMPDVNEQIKNRMDKLKTLQEEGRDPFEITKYDVTTIHRILKNILKILKARKYPLQDD